MKVLIIEHAPGRAEGLDVIAYQNEVQPVLWRAHLGEPAPSLDGIDYLIIGGGPMSANETEKHSFFWDEMPLIERCSKAKMPILAICLGAQLIAKMLGGKVVTTTLRKGFRKVRRTPKSQVDPAFRTMDPHFTSFQYHQDEVVELPTASSVITATSEDCHVEGFCIPELNISAVQFHPEIGKDKAIRVLGLQNLERENQDEHHLIKLCDEPTFRSNARLFHGFFDQMDHTH